MKQIRLTPLQVTFIGIVLVAGVGSSFYLGMRYGRNVQQISDITNFDECAKAGYPILQSYPEQCQTPDRRTFTKITTPLPAISQPATTEKSITLSGKLDCLSYKDKTHTQECRIGFRADDGKYYRLLLNMQKDTAGLATTKRIMVTGMLVNLPTDNIYNITADIEVSSITVLN